MDWQLTFTCVAIGLAGAYVFARGWRSWRGTKTGCGGGCGCAKRKNAQQPQPALIPVDQLVMRRRKD